jgi:hypothetical protein
MRSKLLASVSALALAATIAACSDSPTAPTGKPSFDQGIISSNAPCKLVGQPTGTKFFATVRDAIAALEILVNNNALNCGQANAFFVHVENAIQAIEGGRCQQAANSLASAAHYVDKLVEEEQITNVTAHQLRTILHQVAQVGEAAPEPVCEDLGVADPGPAPTL